ncbi:MAG: hypothetical protein JXR84_28500 [Anaerolineae bacterium]|nr:hypothetical protein [Anaerolineae bacterium]
MKAVCFELHLIEPVLATALGGDPNSAVSLPFIPGSMIRGMLIGRYLRQHKKNTLDLGLGSADRKCFFDGHLLYLNTYPGLWQEDEKMIRMLPSLAAWHVQKYTTGETVYDLSMGSIPGDLELTRVSAPFCWPEKQQVNLYTPRKRVAIHTQRDRIKGRATEGSGAVFQYEALAPGEILVGAIVCPDPDQDKALLDEIHSLLEDQKIKLGGSQSAGYGLVDVARVWVEDDWKEADFFVDDIEKEEVFSVTLLSDAICRDSYGQYLSLLSASYLETQLGIPPHSLDLMPERTFVQTTVIGGFNRTWGLPLEQQPGIRASSVCVYKALTSISKTALCTLVKKGIGERCTEGFGRIAINWPGYETLTCIPPIELSPEPAELRPGYSTRLAQRMVQSMLRQRLEQVLVERVNGLRLEPGANLANTQLARLRVLGRDASFSRDPNPLLRHLDGLTATTRRNFARARIVDTDTIPVLTWLRQLLEGSPEDIWHYLYRSSLEDYAFPKIATVVAHWTPALAKEYVLRLIDAVLSRAIEQRRAQ